ncbi:MAG: hypothetical protein IBJ03_05935 [Gemmatimonadaceae bacterium]|nr:hypothetical protein [Gemmatimonadaceae bacterium]
MTVPALACLITGVATAMNSSSTVDVGSVRDTLSSPACVTVSSTTADVQWNDAPGIPGAQFAIVWNAQFQTHDIIWANRTAEPLRLQFATDSVAEGAARIARRQLGPKETESLPGATVIPSRATRDVCVRTVLRK